MTGHPSRVHSVEGQWIDRLTVTFGWRRRRLEQEARLERDADDS